MPRSDSEDFELVAAEDLLMEDGDHIISDRVEDDDDEQVLILPPGGMELLSPSFKWLGSPTARDEAFARASNSSYETTRSSEFARGNNLTLIIPERFSALDGASAMDAIDGDAARADESPGPLTVLLNSHIAGAHAFAMSDRADSERAYRAFIVSPVRSIGARDSPRA